MNQLLLMTALLMSPPPTHLDDGTPIVWSEDGNATQQTISLPGAGSGGDCPGVSVPENCVASCATVTISIRNEDGSPISLPLLVGNTYLSISTYTFTNPLCCNSCCGGTIIVTPDDTTHVVTTSSPEFGFSLPLSLDGPLYTITEEDAEVGHAIWPIYNGFINPAFPQSDFVTFLGLSCGTGAAAIAWAGLVEFPLPPVCANADVNGDGFVNVIDLLFVLNEWGNSPSFADTNDDDIVDVWDLVNIICNWNESEAPCYP